MSAAIDYLTEKLARFSPERITEVINFVDFLAERELDRNAVRAAQALNSPALLKIWDNASDAVYDRL